MQQVNFSQLNQLKKQEFFNYLLSNNIQFKEGQSNYYAKVVLKPNQQQVHTIKHPKVKSKDMSKDKGTKQLFRIKTEENQNSRIIQKQNRPPRFNIKEKNTSFVKRPIMQRLSTPSRSPLPLFSHNRKQLSLSDHSITSQLNLSDIIANTSQKSQKCKSQRSQTSNNQSKIQDNKRKQYKLALPEKQKGRKQQISKNKQYQQRHFEKPPILRPQEKLGPYLRIFNIRTVLSRPSKWPRHQLDKAIQQIYSACFIKNNTLLKINKFKQATQRQYVFASFIHEIYEHKFKTKKSIQFNLVNLINSLTCHFDGSKNIQIFNRFLIEQYQYQDLSFFLYVRNLIQKQLKHPNNHLQKRTKIDDDDFKSLLTYKEALKIIKSLVGKDDYLFEQYSNLINQYLCDGMIFIYEVLEILLNNYHMKRQNSSNMIRGQNHSSATKDAPINHSRQNSSFLQKSIQTNSIDFQVQSQSQQLTFGESIVHHRQPNDGFWYETNKKAQIPTDPLQVAIVQKMDKMISDLIQHILQDDQQFRLTISQFHGLIFNKARNLIRAVFEMDKISWFKMLNIQDVTTNNLIHVQRLQKTILKLRNEGDYYLLNKFCKSILTTDEFLQAIKKIVIG